MGRSRLSLVYAVVALVAVLAALGAVLSWLLGDATTARRSSSRNAEPDDPSVPADGEVESESSSFYERFTDNVSDYYGGIYDDAVGAVERLFSDDDPYATSEQE